MHLERENENGVGEREKSGRLPIDHKVDNTASTASIERRVPFCVELGLGSTTSLSSKTEAGRESEREEGEAVMESKRVGKMEYLSGFEAEAHFIASSTSNEEANATQCQLTLQDDGSLLVQYFKTCLNTVNVSTNEDTKRKTLMFEKVLVVPVMQSDEDDNQSGSVHVA
jgi:hypothetical protein